MSVSFQPLVAATPAFNERGIIKNETYNDVYHSTAGAQAQTDYVFLQGNDLPKRWQGQRLFRGEFPRYVAALAPRPSA